MQLKQVQNTDLSHRFSSKQRVIATSNILIVLHYIIYELESMPELPEVETTRRGIRRHICGAMIEQVIVRQCNLRWPIPKTLPKHLKQQTLNQLSRRGKYLLFHLDQGVFMFHLGMSGSLRIVQANEPIKKHDHVDICFENGNILRYHDPRRFGALLWLNSDPQQHPLLAKLGPEPLSKQFNPDYLLKQAAGRKTAIKAFIMNAAVVVGVGNIYATEALYHAGIHPQQPAGQIHPDAYTTLVATLKSILSAAIRQGGTTLKDFVGGDGKPGYFKQSLAVYGRQGATCRACTTPLASIKLAQRATVFCPNCQPWLG